MTGGECSSTVSFDLKSNRLLKLGLFPPFSLHIAVTPVIDCLKNKLSELVWIANFMLYFSFLYSPLYSLFINDYPSLKCFNFC